MAGSKGKILNYYALLGFKPEEYADAKKMAAITDDQVKKQYKKRAPLVHSDRIVGAEAERQKNLKPPIYDTEEGKKLRDQVSEKADAEFKAFLKAYETLSDGLKREFYNKFQHLKNEADAPEFSRGFGGRRSNESYQSVRTKLENKVIADRAAGLKPDLTGFSLYYANLSGLDLHDCIFSRNKNPASLHGVDFTGANLEGAQFDGAELGSAIFDNAKARGASFKGTHGYSVSFKNANLQKAVFDDTSFTFATFNNASMEDAQFVRAKSKYNTYVGAKANRANFTRTQLKDADLSNAVFDDADFTSAYIDAYPVKGASWKNAKLKNTKIDDGMARDPNFNLSGAKLDNARTVDYFKNDIGELKLKSNGTLNVQDDAERISAKLTMATAATAVGLGATLTLQKQLDEKKKRGEEITWGDRARQGVVWVATLGGAAYTAKKLYDMIQQKGGR